MEERRGKEAEESGLGPGSCTVGHFLEGRGMRDA